MSKYYLRFWGVRGSHPTPYPENMKIGGNTPCVEIRMGDQVIFLDGGTGIIQAGHSILAKNNTKHISVLLTHYHWDHIQGLTFFLPSFIDKYSIDFYGPALSDEELKNQLAKQMSDPFFPVETAAWLANINYYAAPRHEFTIGEAKITRFNLHHPGLTHGYKIEIRGKTIIYAPDHEIFFLHRTVDDRMHEFEVEDQQLLEEIKKENCQKLFNIMQDADYLIHDCQYSRNDYQKKRGWGHSCFYDTINFAIDAKIKELFFFSYEPTYCDNMVEEQHREALTHVKERNASLVCHMTHEGMELDLS